MEDRRVDTREARRCTRPPASASRRPRAARKTSACAASRSPPAATSTSTASATRRSTSATSSTSTGSRCCAARRRCCSAAARPAASSTRSASRPVLADVSEVTTTVGTGSYLRAHRRLQPQDLGETSALRLNVMTNNADNYGNIDRQERHRADLPLGHRHAPTSSRSAATTSTTTTASTTACPGCARRLERPISDDQPGGPDQGRPEELLRRRQRLQRRLAPPTARSSYTHRFEDGGELHTVAAPAAATTATSAPRRSASARTTNAQTVPIPTARSIAPTQDDGQRRDAADPRHQQQGAGPAGRPTCRPTTRNDVQLVRPQERGAGRRRPGARGVQQLRDGRCRPASS